MLNLSPLVQRYSTIRILPNDVGEPGEARTGKRNHTFNERNVVILGKIGTGKRTSANRIVGEQIFQPSEHSDSEHSDSEQHYEEKRAQNMLYRILYGKLADRSSNTVYSTVFREDPFDHTCHLQRSIHRRKS